MERISGPTILNSSSDAVLNSERAASYYWTPGKRDTAGAIYKQAAYLAEQQLEANPPDPEVISDLADYYGMMGNSPKALSFFTKASAGLGAI